MSSISILLKAPSVTSDSGYHHTGDSSTFGSTNGVASLQAHYTEAAEIRDLMTALLGDVSGCAVLEPAAGNGAFIESLRGVPRKVDAVDVDAAALNQIRAKYGNRIRTIHADFIDLFVNNSLLRQRLLEPAYDVTIANPPYGLKIPLQYRKEIKRAYPKIYARESYALFFEFSLRLLREGGRYVFIVPDTFLHLTYHRPLRRALVTRGAPTHIIQFRSSRFQSVNFGYGNLCIIAGHASKLAAEASVTWIDARNSNENLDLDLVEQGLQAKGQYLIDSCETGWFHPSTHEQLALVDNQGFHPLGDIAECRTGLYTGNNSQFCGYSSSARISRGKGHPINWDNEVCARPLTQVEFTSGITDGPSYVPLIRGGHREPFATTNWAVNWSKDAVTFYRTNKKARLQNAGFYFRSGLAVPMVTTGRLSASIMDHAVFDQGVVGVFPHDKTLLNFLLIYLNSDFATKRLRRTISGSANNSANYIKKIAVPVVSDEIRVRADVLTEKARKLGWAQTKAEREGFVEDIIRAATSEDMP